jgi:hypothetical protein
MWIEGILRSLPCSINPPPFGNVISATQTFITRFGMSDFVPRPCVAEPLASLICRAIRWFEKQPRESADVQLKWIRFLPIGYFGQSFGFLARSFGHIWDSCNSPAASLYKRAR